MLLNTALKAAVLTSVNVAAKNYCVNLIPFGPAEECLQVDWPVQLEKSIEVQLSVYCDLFGSESGPITFNQTSPQVFEVSERSRAYLTDYVSDVREICAGVMTVYDSDLSYIYEIDNDLVLNFDGAKELSACSCP
ncbi:hypothetical protein FOL47_002751 [Perkinsus chesapeaki]|uniref:Uncharacterized protein n=1 Tax=Perkinsus chesapeaki TaxID=330153 RepID=A0A7J6KNA5_PERCH|nr:hypothetical protein FOL47_002751 [Perkinsus chesapeaki]